RVGVRLREAQRDAIVVSDDEARDPREGEADELVAGAFQYDLVPDRWIPHGEVRIAGEDRLAARRPRAGEGPAVRADPVARSWQDRVERERARTRRTEREQTGDGRPGALVDGRRAARWIGHERPEHPRAEPLREARAKELLRVVVRGVVDLQLRDDDRIDDRPRVRAVPKDDELDRQRFAVPLEE